MLRLAVILLISLPTFGQISFNTTKLDHWKDDNLLTNSSEIRYNECEGFEFEGKEYAVAGSTEGTHFFHVTTDGKLDLIDSIRGKYVNSLVVHRDFAVYRNYVYSVCDEGLSSLQVVDISQLPNSIQLVNEDDSNFVRVHNITIDTTNALLYACTITQEINGSLQQPRAMQVYSLADPIHPTLIHTGPTDIPEVHDVFVKDNIAILSCGADGLRVYDYSNPTSPVYLQNMSFYQDQGYNHQGWLSPDGKTFIFGDESEGKQLKKCSFDGTEVEITSLFGTNWLNNSVPHNLFMTDKFVFVAYYNEGLRIYDYRSTQPREVAYYDTYPTEEPLFKMRGAWGVHVLPNSERILVSDRVHGLFLIDFDQTIFSSSVSGDLAIYPSPINSGETVTVRLSNFNIEDFIYRVIDHSGRIVYSELVNGQNFTELNTKGMRAGVYTIEIEYSNEFDETDRFNKKLLIF